MTKVENLRAYVMGKVSLANPCDYVDLLIAAARAEGAEQERERIIRGSERFPEGVCIDGSEYFGIAYGVHEDNTVANSEVFVVPASVLAPVEVQ